MSKVLKFGLACALVFGLSGLAINKILEKPTSSCVNEVAELTQASDAIAGMVFVPDKNTLDSLSKVLKPNTITNISLPYVMVAALGGDGMTVYIKILFEDSKTYSAEVEAEVKQLKASMHKDENQCSLDGKKYDVYRAKTLLEMLKMSNPI